jgi:hypothetical protein
MRDMIAEFERYCERNAVGDADKPAAMERFLREYLEAPEIRMERVDRPEDERH